jgi:predicted Zn-ribbon and HTH transcriptional regulator
MSTDGLIFGYVVVLLAALSAVAIFRASAAAVRTNPERDNIFRCEKCSFVYTDDSDVERSRCPQCGTVNNVIKF